MAYLGDSHNSAYALHLSKMGESRRIMASEDICNRQGCVLLKKGAAINRSTADRIVRFKLLKPIEDTISIADCLDEADLERDITQVTQDIPAFKALHEDLNLGPVLGRLTAQVVRYPLLVQKMTVLQAQMPDLYVQSMRVTWLSTAIAVKMQLDPEALTHCFIAALTHDLGMMHISHAVIAKTTDLSPEEWRQVQSHTIIGQKFLAHVPRLPKLISKIVLEHHERCDGTGYPQGKFGDDLSIESQIIAMCDTLITVYFKKLRPAGRTLRHLLPIMQVNNESHFYRTYACAIELLRSVTRPRNVKASQVDLDRVVGQLLKQDDHFADRFDRAKRVMSHILSCPQSHQRSSIEAVFFHISKTVYGSGIIDPGYRRWLRQVKDQNLDFAFSEIEDVSLMLGEMEWHISRLVKMLILFAENGDHCTEEMRLQIRIELRNRVNFSAKSPVHSEPLAAPAQPPAKPAIATAAAATAATAAATRKETASQLAPRTSVAAPSASGSSFDEDEFTI